MTDFKNGLKQSVISSAFNGDHKAFHEAQTESYREMLSWDNINESATILPKLEKQALEYIVNRLGFLPEPYIRLPHEPFIRALITSHQTGAMSDTELNDRIEECLIQMRNVIVSRHKCFEYPETVYQDYEEVLPEYRQRVIDRLTRFIGYKPIKASSVYVENQLRVLMSNDTEIFPETPTPADFQAILVIKYREQLLTKSLEDAEASALPV